MPYTVILLKCVGLSQLSNCKSQFVSEDVSNCLYRLTVHPVTSSHLSSFLYTRKHPKLSRRPSLAQDISVC